MARGRKSVPDEIKFLKGNPGKRRLVLQQADPIEESGAPIKPPNYVSSELERNIFARIAEDLNRARFVRRTDADTLGRWCVYLARWISIKKRLDGKKADVYYETASKHGKMLRVHPLFASLFKVEQHLMALEDRIGLNPTSRQAIVRGLINAPQLPAGDLFGDSNKPEKPADDPQGKALVAAAAAGPIGFLSLKH